MIEVVDGTIEPTRPCKATAKPSSPARREKGRPVHATEHGPEDLDGRHRSVLWRSRANVTKALSCLHGRFCFRVLAASTLGSGSRAPAERHYRYLHHDGRHTPWLRSFRTIFT